MKFTSKLSLFAILFAALAVSAFAGQSEKKTITISEKAQVAGTELTPGNYTLQWDSTTTTPAVTFLRNGKSVATVPATIVKQQKNPSNANLEFHQGNGVEQLDRVYLKGQILEFGNGGNSPTGASSSGSAQ
jgi:hypothetical protein